MGCVCVLSGEVSPALFQKLEKRTLILEKNALIVVIHGLNSSFKVQLLGASRGKDWRFSKCLSKCPNPAKAPLP